MIVPGMVAYIYNPNTEEVEDYKLEASLDYIPRPCLKKKNYFQPNRILSPLSRLWPY
jgi:hypothetical protein